jgi:hypothetical protein
MAVIPRWFAGVGFLVFLVLGGCAPSEPLSTKLTQVTDDAWESDSWVWSYPGHLPHESVVAGMSVTCGSLESECHPGIAQLFASNYTQRGTQMAVCTAFLISADTAMTNTHCLPPTLRRAGSKCAGQVSLIFPRLRGLRSEIVGCGTVEEARPIYPEWGSDRDSQLRLMSQTADYAVIRLQGAVTRPALRLSRRGIYANEKLFIHAVDPSEGFATASYVPRRCVARETTYHLFSSDIPQQPFSPRFYMSECAIRSGNSGAPLMDHMGDVRGIVNQRVRSSSPASDAMGVNLACVSIPREPRGGPPPACVPRG